MSITLILGGGGGGGGHIFPILCDVPFIVDCVDDDTTAPPANPNSLLSVLNTIVAVCILHRPRRCVCVYPKRKKIIKNP